MQRKCLDLSRWRQIDLLHIARTLWKGRVADCTLLTLEQEILGFHRQQDLPSHQIPQIYFEFFLNRGAPRRRSASGFATGGASPDAEFGRVGEGNSKIAATKRSPGAPTVRQRCLVAMRFSYKIVVLFSDSEQRVFL
ncbi:MAG: ribonuclease H-like domain-containing protein [Acidobacteria bacterium]|nr:ribonuclease H-like domain-containing protein [Acidobacteriota bacterium]